MPAIVLILAILSQPPQSSITDEIAAPRGWVAFSADLRGTGPQGPFEGKFYRGADGSTRKETGRPGGPIDTIVIQNVTRDEQYVCRKTCATGPFTGSKTPRRMRTSLPGLTKLEKKIEGYEAYEWKSGVTSVVLPALNFFAVQMDSSMLSETYSNIRVGSQPAELFELPKQQP